MLRSASTVRIALPFFGSSYVTEMFLKHFKSNDTENIRQKIWFPTRCLASNYRRSRPLFLCLFAESRNLICCLSLQAVFRTSCCTSLPLRRDKPEKRFRICLQAWSSKRRAESSWIVDIEPTSDIFPMLLLFLSLCSSVTISARLLSWSMQAWWSVGTGVRLPGLFV